MFEKMMVRGLFAAVVAGTLLAAPGFGQNLVVNGGFETGDFTGWTRLPAASGSYFGVGSILVHSALVHSGTYAAYFGATGSADDRITQSLPTAAGRSYTIQFWLDHSSTDSQDDFSATWNGTTLLSMSNASSFGYTEYTYTGAASSGTSTIEFSGRDASSYFYLDDVSVVLNLVTSTWNGGGADANWMTAANWGGTAPIAGNALTFSGKNRLTNNNDFAANTLFNGITFNNTAGAFTLNGNPINLGSDVVNNNPNVQTINLGLALQQAVNFNAAAGNLLIAGGISGSGSLNVPGSAVVTLAGSNSYTGGTTISGGTLQVGSGGNTGSLAGNITNNATLVFNRSDSPTFGGAIAGSGSLTQAGPGLLTLFASNSYTGATTISAGTLQLGNGTSGNDGSLATSGIKNNATLAYDPYGAQTAGYVVSGSGGLALIGPGKLTVSASDSYAGPTTVNSGTLAIGVANALPFGAGYGNVSLAASATLDLAGNSVAVNGLTSLGTIGNSGAAAVTLTVGNNNQNSQLYGVLKNTGGSLALDKTGTGTLTLANTNNTYAGGTTINGGVLNIAADGSLGAASGPVTFTTTAGTLQAAASMALNAARGMTIRGSGATIDTQTNAVSVAGTISGTGALTKIGAGTLVLSGTNAYSGGTTVNAGIVQAGNNFALGPSTASLAVNGGEFDVHGYSVYVGQLNGAGTIDNLYGSGTLTVGNGDASSTFAGIVQDTSGQLALDKTGSGTFSLAGNVTLAGAATVSGGALNQSGGFLNPVTVIVDGGAFSLIGGSVSAPTEYLGYSVSGSFTQSGGTHALSSYLYFGYQAGSSGSYNLKNGLLTSSWESVGYSGSGSFLQSGGSHAVSGYLFLGSNSDLGLGTQSSGSYNLSAGSLSASYEIIGAYGSGSFTQSGGTHTISTEMAVGWLAGGSGTYGLSGGGLSAPAAYIGYSGSGAFTQSGGIVALSSLVLAQSAAASGTYNLNGGSLVLSVSGLTSGLGAAAFNFGGGTLGASAPWPSALDINMSGMGGSGTVDTTGGNISLSGNLSGSGGLTKAGPGTLALTGSNTYTGGTTISGGTLQVGSGGNTGSLAGNITNNATLVFNCSDSPTFGGAIAGSGSLTQAGPGLLTLAGSNTYTGGTTISGGTLQVGSGGNTGSLAGIIMNNATLVFNCSDSPTFSGAIAGSGGLTKAGPGTLALTGSNTYTGGTTVDSGQFVVDGSSASPVTVSGGTLGGTGSLTNVTVNAGGNLAPGDALGTLSISGSLVLELGAVMDYELDFPGTSDMISCGYLELNGQQFSDLNITPTANFGPGIYNLIEFGSSIGSLGTNTTGTIDGEPAILAVQGNNDLVLVVVPEPSTLALLIAAAGGWVAFRRQRRRKTTKSCVELNSLRCAGCLPAKGVNPVPRTEEMNSVLRRAA